MTFFPCYHFHFSHFAKFKKKMKPYILSAVTATGSKRKAFGSKLTLIFCICLCLNRNAKAMI